jgi:hypothetical protein
LPYLPKGNGPNQIAISQRVVAKEFFFTCSPEEITSLSSNVTHLILAEREISQSSELRSAGEQQPSLQGLVKFIFPIPETIVKLGSWG